MASSLHTQQPMFSAGEVKVLPSLGAMAMGKQHTPPNGKIAEDNKARLLSSMYTVQMYQESLKNLQRLRDHMTVGLEDTLHSVAKLEQQQVALRAILRARCEELRQAQAAEPEPSVALVNPALALLQKLAASRLQGASGLRMVPGPLQEAAKSSASSPASLSLGQKGTTTLMIRPIPRCCSQEQLVALWPANCAASPYDMLYAPHRRKTRKCNDVRQLRKGLQGYVFINFLTVEGAERFREAWHGRVPEASELFPEQEWSSPLEITEAKAQGFDENMRDFTAANLDLLDSDLWPVVLVNGQCQNFKNIARSFRP